MNGKQAIESNENRSGERVRAKAAFTCINVMSETLCVFIQLEKFTGE